MRAWISGKVRFVYAGCGTYAFVLINNNEKSKKITVSDGQRHFAYDVPGKSVTSYRWAKSK